MLMSIRCEYLSFKNHSKYANINESNMRASSCIIIIITLLFEYYTMILSTTDRQSLMETFNNENIFDL